jgi:hypothetical protein
MNIQSEIAAATAERERIEARAWNRYPSMDQRGDLRPYLFALTSLHGGELSASRSWKRPSTIEGQGNAVARAYNRSDAIERRRALMQVWGS